MKFEVPLSRSQHRRSFLRTTSLAAEAAWSGQALGNSRRSVKLSAYPFSLGVVSGDPTADGFVIWTRLAPQPLEFDGGMPAESLKVAWEVAENDSFSRVVARGTANAVPEWAHSVHVELEGLLPDRWYFYRFHFGSETSPPGRTRTMPALGTLPERLRFAFTSCQHNETGHYTAYEHMFGEDVDLVFHLGDYLYEYAGADERVRKHIGPEITTLPDYRQRHAHYRSDPALQAMHAAAPWMVTWDDHEFDNNWAGDISEEDGIDHPDFLKRRAAAFQADYEHMPLRRSLQSRGDDPRSRAEGVAFPGTGRLGGALERPRPAGHGRPGRSHSGRGKGLSTPKEHDVAGGHGQAPPSLTLLNTPKARRLPKRQTRDDVRAQAGEPNRRG